MHRVSSIIINIDGILTTVTWFFTLQFGEVKLLVLCVSVDSLFVAQLLQDI